MARVAPGNAPPSPMPNRKRKITNETAPVAAAVAAVITDQYATIIAKTRRGPKRSFSQPPGTWNKGEGTEDDAHGDFVEAKLLADDWRHGRDVHPVEIGDEVHQADQEEDVPPTHAAACSLRLHDALSLSRRADRGRYVGASRPAFTGQFSSTFLGWILSGHVGLPTQVWLMGKR